MGVGTALKALLPPMCLKWQDEPREKAYLGAPLGAAILMTFLCQRNWGENTLEPGQLCSAFMCLFTQLLLRFWPTQLTLRPEPLMAAVPLGQSESAT